jgi:uncharacterized NAD(P)/FAD-binding protein YdhS
MPQTAIAVVGSGFTGTLLSILLRNMAPAGTRMYLIERTGTFAHGLAYGTANPRHLLNVPAGRMSAFPDLPLDFLHWAQRQPAAILGGITPSEDAFLPRSAYGAYLQQLLECPPLSGAGAELIQLRDAVTAVDESPAGLTLHLAAHPPLPVDLAVLATGNPPPQPRHGGTDALAEAGLWCNDPWDPATLAGLDPTTAVLLVGTGLTTVDLVISLLDNGHTGPIHAVSRHGLLPRRHASGHAAVTLPTPLPNRLLPLVRLIRQQIAATMVKGGDWRPVIDALRPFTQDLWRGFSPVEKARFLRHLCSWWDVHRHRMPPASAQRVEAALASGQLMIHAGGIIHLEAVADVAHVTYRPRGAGMPQALAVARVINCTAPCGDVGRSADPLTRALLHTGTVRPDALRLGLDVTADGAVLGADGVASRRLFAMGPLTKGEAWEITAVPDIRRQCRDMAARLAECLAAVRISGLERTQSRQNATYPAKRINRL